jgi:hypothetical protein
MLKDRSVQADILLPPLFIIYQDLPKAIARLPHVFGFTEGYGAPPSGARMLLGNAYIISSRQNRISGVLPRSLWHAEPDGIHSRHGRPR